MDVIHSDTDGNNIALTCPFQLEERQESKGGGISHFSNIQIVECSSAVQVGMNTEVVSTWLALN